MSGIAPNRYLVKNVKDSCAECTDSMLCQKVECKLLCQYVYLCSCYDYNNGRLCKHVHCVHSLVRPTVPSESDNDSIKQQKVQLYKPIDEEANEGHTAPVVIAANGIQPNHHNTGYDKRIVTTDT